jgi:sensor histidine kinase YesM
MLQPLVENSLKHGCGRDGRPLHLALEADRDADWLTLRFIDDGVPNGRNGRGLGVGLENLEQRVRHFGGADASMTATRLEAGGFAVTLRWRETAAPGAVERSA